MFEDTVFSGRSFGQMRQAGMDLAVEAAEKRSVAPVLQQLFFEVTQKCNLSCVFCGSKCDLHSSSDELDLDVCRRVLERVKQEFGTDVFIVLTGGEPLLYSRLFDLAAMIDDLGF